MDEQKNPESQTEQEQPQEEMKERVISEKVVSEKVIGSSSGVARFGRKVKSQISSRLGGIGLGLLLIIISFVVVWQSEKFEKSADLVEELPVLSVDQAIEQGGLVKVQGSVTSDTIKTPKEDKDVLYYNYTSEELEMVTRTEYETKMVERDGQDIEQTIEKVVESPEWVTKTEDEKWAEIVLDNKIMINPLGAKKVLNYTTVYSMEQDEERESIDALLPDGQFIVVGNLSDGQINSGDPFIFTNRSNDQLVENLQQSEKTTWWILKLLTVFLFGFGLYSLLGPFLLVLDAIPVLGNLGKNGIFIVCMLIGLIFTVLGSLVIAYWYIILIIIVLLVGYLFVLKKQEKA